MTNNLRGQRGMTGVGWLIVLALIGFFIMLALKLVPIYLENYNVKTVLNSLKEEPYITKKSPMEIKRLLKKRFDISYINGVDSNKVTIKKHKGVMDIGIAYQVRSHIVGNVDLLVSFDDKVRLISN